ncbi:MAG: BREX-1 system adenine-specific DNA-methyltransferase PglX [Rhodobacteraceae bacterium]|nr:BREX-1 system adenine-specific DNA-methyltransferase PglX [Paracoccaceae bacterium]
MDTNGLKTFARDARTRLMEQVGARLDLVLGPAAPARREHPQAMKVLDAAIDRAGRNQVIEQVAYTWFNRFTALRFMDVNGLTDAGVVSPATEGQTRPGILADAMAGILPDGAPGAVAALLDGRIPAPDPQGEAYRLLLGHACDRWHKTMPFLFAKVCDYTLLLMPGDLLSPESFLARLRRVITADACQDVDILGWLYQFYISEKKDEIFAGLKRNRKIPAEDIPAATQLFTPRWIVHYLVENSLGRLWLLNRPGSRLARQMPYYIAPDEASADFLPIDGPQDIRVCDPACGSGHMLTYAFDLLTAMYEEEGYNPIDIPALILRHNLTGVEICPRAGGLAAFALAMKAALVLGRRRFLRMEVKPDICVLQDVTFTPAELDDVAARAGRAGTALRAMLMQFGQAGHFGALIVPGPADPAQMRRDVAQRDFGTDMLGHDLRGRVMAVLDMAAALGRQYHVVVANPPYMGSKGMNAELRDFAKQRFPDSKRDLYAMFMERALGMCRDGGLVAMITMQAWMFISSFGQLRGKLLSDTTLLSMAHLGMRGFDTIGGGVVSTTAFVTQNALAQGARGIFVRLVDGRSEAEKSALMRAICAGKCRANHFRAAAADFRQIPGAPIAYWVGENWRKVFRRSIPLGDVTNSSEGVKTGNNARFLRYWFEVNSRDIGPFVAHNSKWVFYLKGGSYRRWYGNAEYVVFWAGNGTEVKAQANSGIQGEAAFRMEVATWTHITSGKYSARLKPAGYLFDVKGPVGYFVGSESQENMLAFLNSKVCCTATVMLNPTLCFNVGNFRSLPYFPVKAGQVKRLVTLAKADWDAHERSWDFAGSPLLLPGHREDTLAGTWARLRAHWQALTDEMQGLEEANNRIFINAYGLQDELDPAVPADQITLTCNPAYRYGTKLGTKVREARLLADTMAEFVSYAVGCMFGRYSPDAPGLILASQGHTLDDYLAAIPQPRFMPAKHNVIPMLRGDWFADDISARFRTFLGVTFGAGRLRENLAFIESALGRDIRSWFIRDFYADHVKRSRKRPIYWMFSSPEGTFNALVYIHRFQPDTVSVLLGDYLREFISKLAAEQGRLEKLADDPAAGAAQRNRALRDINLISRQLRELQGWERDVIFPLAQARVGIDLDNGVKANYHTFGAALRKIPGLDGPG